MSCNIKYEDYQVIQRTLIIVCTNRIVFPDNEEFNVRMYKLVFNKYDFSNIKKRILPVTLYDLFCKYYVILTEYVIFTYYSALFSYL